MIGAPRVMVFPVPPKMAELGVVASLIHATPSCQIVVSVVFQVLLPAEEFQLYVAPLVTKAHITAPARTVALNQILVLRRSGKIALVMLNAFDFICLACLNYWFSVRVGSSRRSDVPLLQAPFTLARQGKQQGGAGFAAARLFLLLSSVVSWVLRI